MNLCIEHISKRFKDMTAVDDISLRLTPGVWGLLGANGAGKTFEFRNLKECCNFSEFHKNLLYHFHVRLCNLPEALSSCKIKNI